MTFGNVCWSKCGFRTSALCPSFRVNIFKSVEMHTRCDMPVCQNNLFLSPLKSKSAVFPIVAMRTKTSGLLPLLQTLALLSSTFCPVQATGATCKSTPDDASWPSIHQWNHLNDTLGGRLLHPPPPALQCHSTAPGSNDTCADIKSSWSTFGFHQDNPISTAWNNMNNDSCLPTISTPCSGLGYPVYVVNATSAVDVKLAIDFARKNNIRLNVKASGHDYLKRYVYPFK
jgi:hypothetical protein